MTETERKQAFGKRLCEFRLRRDMSQPGLAKKMEVGDSTVSDWEAGKYWPSTFYFPRFRSALGLTPAEYADWCQLAGLAAPLLEPEPRHFVPHLLRSYVARPALEAALWAALTVDGEQPRAAILHGATGMGKSTVAVHLARRPELLIHFPDGVLWIDVPALTDTAYAQWCETLGLERAPGEGAIDTWGRWLRAPDRRCLLILDDVWEADILTRFLTPLAGPVGVLITTQQPTTVYGALTRWLAAPHIHSIAVAGLTEAEARNLVAVVVTMGEGRFLTDAEWALLKQIGQAIGWHPEALRLVAAQPAEWDSVLKQLRDGAWPTQAQQVKKLAQHQLERLDEEARQRLTALVQLQARPPPDHQDQEARQRRADPGQLQPRPRPFGLVYAAVVWQTELAVAQSWLEDLTRQGMLEPMAEVEDRLQLAAQVWQVTPVVYQVLTERLRPPTPSRQQQSAYRRARAAALRRLQRYHEAGWEAPPQFLALATLWWTLVGLPKALVMALLWLWDQGWGTHGYERWLRWTSVLATDWQLEQYRVRTSTEPLEEFWLLYEAKRQRSMKTVALEAGLLVVGLGFSWLTDHLVLDRGTTLGLLGLGLLLGAAGLYLVWRSVSGLVWHSWALRHYGVADTWDLRLILYLARRLGMREPPA